MCLLLLLRLGISSKSRTHWLGCTSLCFENKNLEGTGFRNTTPCKDGAYFPCTTEVSAPDQTPAGSPRGLSGGARSQSTIILFLVHVWSWFNLLGKQTVVLQISKGLGASCEGSGYTKAVLLTTNLNIVFQTFDSLAKVLIKNFESIIF